MVMMVIFKHEVSQRVSRIFIFIYIEMEDGQVQDDDQNQNHMSTSIYDGI